jgi:hypothetical protein
MNNTTAIVQSIIFSSIPFAKTSVALQVANDESRQGAAAGSVLPQLAEVPNTAASIGLVSILIVETPALFNCMRRAERLRWIGGRCAPATFSGD